MNKLRVISGEQISKPATMRKKRPLSGKESSALEHETKEFLGQSRARTTAYRAASYRPTLEKFSSVSFSDYVRRVILGVPIDGVAPEDAYFSTDDCSDDDSANDIDVSKPKSNEAVTNKQTEDSVCTETNVLDVALEQTSSIPTLPVQKIMAAGGKKNNQPGRMTTRSQTGAKGTDITKKDGIENIYEKKFSANKVPCPKCRKRKKIGPPLKPDELKLSDGIAKITPPIGWWDKAGIGKDMTGRGATWQAEGDMGKMVIPGPIKQCVAGIGGVYEFAMLELPSLTVSKFRDKADEYRKRQIGTSVDEDVSNECMDKLARKFWRRLGPTMEASIYGADMEGSLFNEAEACGWNVDQLESCLQLLRADSTIDFADDSRRFKLPGVMSAYLYFGMWASVFAAHTEDMNLPSINYLHAGAPKYWYAISPEDSNRFESLMASHFTSAQSSCPQFLRHKSYLISPSIISKAGISYTTHVQRAGDFIITFPGSYHFGFNTGFNCAESTNFSFPEWMPLGEKAKVCMCHPHSVRIDMDRFKMLYEEYERETSYEDGPSMTYDQWAILELKRRKRRLMKNKDPSDSSANEQKFVSEKSSSKTKEFVVEVIKMLQHRRSKNPTLPSKKKKKRKKKRIEKDNWRVALKAKKSSLRDKTKVICEVKVDGSKNAFFSGVITNVVDEHVRVHFDGTNKVDDIWIQLDSRNIYLDGGSRDSPLQELEKKKGRKR